MNIIEITIGDKNYKISCSPGEEGHVNKLADKLNERFSHLENSLGDKASDNMILVIIGLMLEDELLSAKTEDKSAPAKNNKEKIVALSSKIDGIVAKLESIQNA